MDGTWPWYSLPHVSGHELCRIIEATGKTHIIGRSRKSDASLWDSLCGVCPQCFRESSGCDDSEFQQDLPIGITCWVRGHWSGPISISSSSYPKYGFRTQQPVWVVACNLERVRLLWIREGMRRSMGCLCMGAECGTFRYRWIAKPLGAQL